MTWSYSGDPSVSSKDAVRFLLGDTDSTNTLTVSDEEIVWLLTEWDDNTYFAAAAAAEQMAAQVTPETSYSADGVSYGGDELQQKFEELAARLRWTFKQKGRLAGPYDGSNDPAFNDWRHNVEEIGIGMHDSQRDGANMDEDEGGQNPLAGGDGYQATG